MGDYSSNKTFPRGIKKVFTISRKVISISCFLIGCVLFSTGNTFGDGCTKDERLQFLKAGYNKTEIERICIEQVPVRHTEKLSLKDSGYPGSGHKFNYCRSIGYDNYVPAPNGDKHPWGYCSREVIVKPKCTKRPLKGSGYPGSGHKFNYCRSIGYDSYVPAPNGDKSPWGYCQKGDCN